MKNILHSKTPSIQFNSPFSIIHSPLLNTTIMKNILHNKTPSIQFNSPFSIIHSPLLKTTIMKNIILITLLSLTSPFWRVSNALAQNLVSNPSFEDTVACPTTLTQIDRAAGWMSFSLTPDYFNACAPSNIIAPVSVPHNIWGDQLAHTGNAYVGFATYSAGTTNSREYIATQLIQPLAIGQKYFLSFYVSSAFGYIQSGYPGMATNNIGALFSTVAYSQSNPQHVDNFAHIVDSIIINDTINWVKISGSFIADSAYQYLSIGNFFDDINTNVITIGVHNPNAAYYYLDDVKLSTDSTFVNGIDDYNSNVIKIFPNPANTFIKINGMEGELEINIYDLVGRIVRHTKINNNLLNTESISNGIYLIKIDSKDKTIIKKILIQH